MLSKREEKKLDGKYAHDAFNEQNKAWQRGGDTTDGDEKNDANKKDEKKKKAREKKEKRTRGTVKGQCTNIQRRNIHRYFFLLP